MKWSWILICGFIDQRCLLLELNIVGKSRPFLILNFINIFRLVFSWMLIIDIGNILYFFFVGCHEFDGKFWMLLFSD